MTSVACGIIDGYYMHWFILSDAFTSFQMLLSQNSHTHPPSFQIILDIGVCSALYSFLFGFYTYERILLINFYVLRKNFVILRVSGQNINGEYHLNTSTVSLFSVCFVWPGSNAVFILIVCALPTFLVAFFYTMFYSF